MLTQKFRLAAFALAAGGLTISVPASAVPATHAGVAVHAIGDMTAGYDDDDDDRRRWDRGDRGRHRGWEKRDRRSDRYRSNYRPQGYYAANNGYYGEPVYNNTRVWRGNDGRVYCRKSDGTTGLIIGGAAGALLGRELAGRGDRTLGAILGAAGGALLGKSIDSKTRCN